MPVITPSRIAIALLIFSLASFFWTYGYPHQLSHPSQPIIDHYDHKNVHSKPIIPAPSIPHKSHASVPKPTHHGERPAEEEEDPRWNDGAIVADKTQNASPTQTQNGAFEDDGGRWDDPQKDKQEGSAAATLLTAAHPIASGIRHNGTRPTLETQIDTPTNAHISKFCQDVRGAPHVMVVIRTSKAEIQEKLPTHIKGLLSCVPNFAIFSDHEGEIEGIRVHNALSSIGAEAKRKHDEFHEYQIMHADAEHKLDAGRTKNLDKWKFLPMVYKAFQLKRQAKFFIFIEMDTSLSWTNTLQWVNRLDYRIPYYSGSPSFIDSTQLAQRGSGILLSQGAMRRYAKSYDELYSLKWEEEVGKGCCGDLALARALGDAHVEFYSSWPLLQGEQPSTLDYSQKHWCAPAVTWHHTNGEVLEDIWDSQAEWTGKHGWDKPFLYRDAFDVFVIPYMKTKKVKWDNLSQDTMIAAPQGRQKQIKEEEERSRKHKAEEEAKKDDERAKPVISETKFSDPPGDDAGRHKREDKPKEINWDKLKETFKDAGDSAEKCQKTCEAVENCLQWRYATNKGDGECHLGKVLRLGKATNENDDKWTSGWLIDRVEKMQKEWECKEVSWRFYQ